MLISLNLPPFAEVEKLKPTATVLPPPGAIKGGDTTEQANHGTPTNRAVRAPGTMEMMAGSCLTWDRRGQAEGQ